MMKYCDVSGCQNSAEPTSSFCYKHQPAKTISQKLYETMTGGSLLRYRCKCGAEYPSQEEWEKNHICPLLNKNKPETSLDSKCMICGTAVDKDKMMCDSCEKEFCAVNKVTLPDMVNHPPHYNQGKFEVLDVIEDNLKEGFEPYLVGNILKYVMRYKHKNGIQDLEKAEFYLKRLIQTKRSGQDGNETRNVKLDGNTTNEGRNVCGR